MDSIVHLMYQQSERILQGIHYLVSLLHLANHVEDSLEVMVAENGAWNVGPPPRIVVKLLLWIGVADRPPPPVINFINILRVAFAPIFFH